MFLTPEDLHDLTGYKKPKLQRRWLAENGYRFDVRADGRASVLIDQVRTRQATKAFERATHPDWQALEEII